MGPRLGSRGKSRITIVTVARSPCFNGVATWKSRKAASNNAVRCRVVIASMGPRLGSRGKQSTFMDERIAFTLLQWGRDLEVAESSYHDWGDWLPIRASMEPRLGVRGKPG